MVVLAPYCAACAARRRMCRIVSVADSLAVRRIQKKSFALREINRGQEMAAGIDNVWHYVPRGVALASLVPSKGKRVPRTPCSAVRQKV